MPTKPDSAAPWLPNPRNLRSGPLAPRIEVLSMISSGRSRLSSSQPSPSRSATPGVKLCVTMSAQSQRRRASAMPSAVRRLIAAPSLEEL